MLKKVLKRVPPLKRGLKKLPKRVKRSKKRPKELVSQESAQESGSFKRGGRSKEFATHKSELLKKVLKQVPLYKMFNATNYALKFLPEFIPNIYFDGL